MRQKEPLRALSADERGMLWRLSRSGRLCRARGFLSGARSRLGRPRSLRDPESLGGRGAA